MAKRSFTTSDSQRVKVQARAKTVRVVLLKELKLNISGTITGRTYSFNGAGSIVRVDDRDLPALLEKNTKGGCCGGAVNSPYFEVIGG